MACNNNNNNIINVLKEKAISSNKVWKVTEKPHSGPIFQQRKSDKLAYKIKIPQGKKNELFSYSNSLHDALSQKKMVNSGNIGKLNLEVIIILYHVKLMV